MAGILTIIYIYLDIGATDVRPASNPKEVLLFRKIQREEKGFTLVEVIVVAVIVAILASVAIPLYLGYVRESRINECENAASSVATFCGACANITGTLSPTGNITPGATITCTNPANPANSTTMVTPARITINISSATPPGQVTATHADGGASVNTYNY